MLSSHNPKNRKSLVQHVNVLMQVWRNGPANKHTAPYVSQNNQILNFQCFRMAPQRIKELTSVAVSSSRPSAPKYENELSTWFRSVRNVAKAIKHSYAREEMLSIAASPAARARDVGVLACKTKDEESAIEACVIAAKNLGLVTPQPEFFKFVRQTILRVVVPARTFEDECRRDIKCKEHLPC